MSIEARALSLARLQKESPTVSLLRSSMAPVLLAMVDEYFPQGTRQRPASEIYELLGADLRILTGRHSDKFELPRSAQQYCADWVKAGWLIRRPGTSATGETLEPSEETLATLDAVTRWEQPRATVTATRVESLTESLRTLARDIDPDIATRLWSLQEQRDELDRQIERVEHGDYEVLGPAQVSERVADILGQASAIPVDFARVSRDLEDLNRSLRRQLLDPDGSRGDVLDEIFDGVDLIGESDAGRSFNGFYQVLLDQERAAWIDRWIADILSRPQGDELPTQTRSRLRGLFRSMEDAGAEVNQVMTGLARSLRNYVTSEEFAEDRRMVELLRAARTAAADAVTGEGGDVRAYRKMETPLVRIGMPVTSVSALVLRNPGDETVENAPGTVDEGAVDTAELLAAVRVSEIDLAELQAGIDATLSPTTGLSTATIATVLQYHPASQGLASVVGLLHLAIRHGSPGRGTEPVSWDDGDGRHRTARIPRWIFTTDPEKDT
ncbi:DUF3375 domain-containing protein [Corynebacterium glyciniphilum]|uniref:DUF3375 domain-containing protein n=1 Tax=Corynebacterium glyciniphilum TaxID=1404244 RepID=UPI00264FD3AD|nr:DUF3375 domain-containing protein [Corynebacterium glyciniphilum]MDN5683278.1 DUF3375 domain-containing protein [Corynebacterium glyciniphilum]MDN6706654.1 DUF3375 domain-containing protein [Corynebacterium glyciniphilum]